MPEPTQRVVVTVDASPNARAAVVWAGEDAIRRGVGVHLVHTVVPPRHVLRVTADRAAREGGLADTAAWTLLDHAALRLREHFPTLQVTSRLLRSPAVEALVREASGAVALVLGAPHARHLPQLAAGSVAVQVAAAAPCPVVIVHRDHVGLPVRGAVVVGVDLGSRSAPELAFAVGEAGLRSTGLTALTVVHEPALREALLSPADRNNLAAEAQRRLEELLTPWRTQYPDMDLQARTLRAHPIAAMQQESEGADLLVIGAHGSRRLGRKLLGSVSQALISSARCPLAVVGSLATTR